MATVDTVDTNALVRKYLNRSVTTSRSDISANSGDEVVAVLEAVAITLLLYPQAIFPIVLRSKNTLQQLVISDIGLLDFLSQSIQNVNNPEMEITDTSDLVDAQTALVELGRLGKVGVGVQAYDRYAASINKFLDTKLAKPLKSHRRVIDGQLEIEPSGPEAQQDIFQALAIFQASHQAVADRRKELLAAFSNFQQIDLTRIVSTTTLTRVRSSIQQIISGVSILSKSVMTLELLAGSASLTSISNVRGLFDSLVDTSRLSPDKRTITVDAEPAAATSLSSLGPWTFSGSSWLFDLTVNGETLQSVELPSVGAGGSVFLTSLEGTGTYSILPAGPTSPELFVRVIEGVVVTDLAIPLTTGVAVPFATLVSDINAGVGVYGTCQELYPGSNRFIIYGAATVTRLSLIGFGPQVPYTPPASPSPVHISAHATLGFSDNQTSIELGVFSSAVLEDLLANQLTGVSLTIEGEQLRVTSLSDAPTSSLVFANVASTFVALPDEASEPAFLSLKENGQVAQASDLNILPGAVVVAAETGLGGRVLNASIQSISGERLFFDVPLPRGPGLNVTITSVALLVIQQLLQGLASIASMDSDFTDLQRILAPVLAKPTRAQINDVKKVIADIRQKLTNLVSAPGLLEVLRAAVVRDDQMNFKTQADTMINSLEERGLDRAEDLLKRGLFQDFFALKPENASRAGRFLSAVESIGRTDVASTTVEANLPDGNQVQGTGPSISLQSAEPAP